MKIILNNKGDFILKKKILLFSSLMLLLCTNIFASDLDNYNSYENNSLEIAPRYKYLITNSNSFSITTDGKATCYGFTKTSPDYKAGVKVELQKYTSTWSTVKTWSNIDNISATVYKNYTVAKGTYRLRITHTVLNSNNKILESSVIYSNTKIY